MVETFITATWLIWKGGEMSRDITQVVKPPARSQASVLGRFAGNPGFELDLFGLDQRSLVGACSILSCLFSFRCSIWHLVAGEAV